MEVVLRPNTGRVLTVFVGALCLTALVGLTWQYGLAGGARFAPWLVLVAGGCWATYWRPCVRVDDGGVTLVNVFRTVALPWPSIRVVDTKWGLTLDTAYGRYRAWAAPAPGAWGIARAHRGETRHLPQSSYAPDGVRPGDLPSTASGAAALTIREHWERLRDAGHLDDPRLESEQPPVVWHWQLLAAGAALAVLAVLTMLW